MTNIVVTENSDNQIYNFVVYQKGSTSAEDLTNYTDVVMTILNSEITTNYGDITLAFGTKASGEITYTTDVADPYPSFQPGQKVINLVGKIKITATGLQEITEEIEIIYERDYSTI